MRILGVLLLCLLSAFVLAQEDLDRDSLQRLRYVEDSLYIDAFETKKPSKLKLLHAEPLYIDLIRDLGAHKGEKEWNLGFGLKDNQDYDEYEALIEYEWAPIDRLGLEIELPVSFYYERNPGQGGHTPRNRLHSLKLAAQYSFFVHEKLKTTMALGYLHEFEMPAFSDYGRTRFYKGNLFNPFFVAAKRWGQNFHTLAYVGPQVEQTFGQRDLHWNWQINSNFHYMIPGTRNFIGLEVNQNASKDYFYTVLRPQMRVSLADNLIVGLVTGIPVGAREERFSFFLRLIYEPSHKHERD